ncbi:MAG: hypothetical protein M3N16_06920 [Actinomycetota bacterium]|nr:hypothetical protein [Actinomycetota bacterium]
MTAPGPDPEERVRILIMRGENALRSSRPEHLDRALEAFQEARQVADATAVDQRLRELADERLAETRGLLDDRA